MKKTLIASLLTCVLAIGTVGYAFATGLDFNNGVGALSTGDSTVTDVNVTGVRWGLENNASQPMGTKPYVGSVSLQFDDYLVDGTSVGVTLYNAAGDMLSFHSADIIADIPNGTFKGFPLSKAVNPSDVRNIRVTIAEPVPFK